MKTFLRRQGMILLGGVVALVSFLGSSNTLAGDVDAKRLSFRSGNTGNSCGPLLGGETTQVVFENSHAAPVGELRRIEFYTKEVAVKLGNLSMPNLIKVKFGGEPAHSYGTISLQKNFDVATYLHELGHFILDYNIHLQIMHRLKSNSSELLERRWNLRVKMLEFYENKYKPVDHELLRVEFAQNPDSGRLKQLQQQIEKLNRELNLLEKEHKEIEKELESLAFLAGFDYLRTFIGHGVPWKGFSRGSIGALHELFADTIACIVLKNPNAMSESLLSTEESEVVRSHRSFSNSIDPKTWNPPYLSHGVMAPVMSFIGVHFGEYAKNPAKLFEAMHRVTWQVATDPRYAQYIDDYGTPNEHALSNSDINLLFIEKLRLELSAG